MSIFFICNNKFYKEGGLVISPSNRSFRYGDGLFETMKVIEGQIILKQFHFERLFAGMKTLKFEAPVNFDEIFLEKEIKKICDKNHHTKCARVRLTVFRGDGGLYDAKNNLPNYVIETWTIENKQELNTNGLVIDIYEEAKKSCDKFSNIKSNNFLPYAMAALHAKENKLNDCILLNTHNRICDATIANIFIIKNKKIYTPPLSEGCIAGVVRRWMLENLNLLFKIEETPITKQDVLDADEIFLTNSIYDMRWVKLCSDSSYSCDITQKIFQHLITTIY